MKIRTFATGAIAAFLLSLGLAGCGSSEVPEKTEPPVKDQEIPGEVFATWLEDGRSIALITWGSSSQNCAPTPRDVQADGSTLTVVFSEPDGDIACTADFAPRATHIGVPEDLDTVTEVTLVMRGDGLDGQVSLPAKKAAGDASNEGENSASWFSQSGIVLLTWGSSTCPPIVKGIEETETGATVEFLSDPAQVCTMDFVPRLTVLEVNPPKVAEGYSLTLKGANLDDTLTVAVS